MAISSKGPSPSLLTYLCCPQCHRDLVAKTSRALYCRSCRTSYPVSRDIPVFTDLASLDSHQEHQVDYFEKEPEMVQTPYSLSHWQANYLRRFEDYVPLTKGLIIDSGTGSGYMAIELAKKGFTVLACDITFKSLVHLRSTIKRLHLQDKILLVCCSAEQLPFKKGIAAVFISNAILEHLQAEKAAVAEISRVCRSKSYIFLAVPLKLKYIWPFFWPVNLIHDKRIGHLRRYDAGYITYLFERYGFKLNKVFYTGHLLKVFLAILNIFLRFRLLDEYAEKLDSRLTDFKYGASNVVAVLSR